MFSQSSLAKEYKIGASLLTQQHPFYIDLANAMKEEAKKDNVNLSVSIANQDLNKQLSDVEDFITKKWMPLLSLRSIRKASVQR